MSDENKIYVAIRKALAKLEATRKELDLLQSEPIALVGLACRFPGGSNTAAEFWKFLERGGDGISRVPENRWHAQDFYDSNPEIPGKMISPLGGFLECDVSLFDAGFFGISPREAEFLDPQQRLLLEVSYEAILSMGLSPDSLKGSATGVFLGQSTHDYMDLILSSGNKEIISAYMATGNMASAAAGRISYAFGFTGPNFSLDTACSSSLLAIHQACLSLRNRECNLALAGGVNLILAPNLSIEFSKAKMLAPDGHCKTFDERADGYVRGEGCGIIVLKRLSDAKRDGDIILAVISASGINQDGASAGLTVPNGKAQEALIREVVSKAKIQFSDIDYVEAHGTGTALGDPIEVRALAATYGQRDSKNPLKLGSVKTNIGHLESAAGVASVIKVVLALQNEIIPKQLHFKKLNPNIDPNWPLKIASENEPWKRSERVRRAAVSSFGFSGTNAHVIMEEGPKLSESELLQVKDRLSKTQKFQRKRYWVKAQAEARASISLPDINLLLQNDSSEKDQKILLDFIAKVASQVVGFDADESVDVKKNFYDIGMNSLMLVNFTDQLQAAFKNQLKITVDVVLENPTVERLTLLIQSRLSGQAKTPAKEMKISTANEIMQSPRWITEIPGAEKTKLRIFCFPHAGGGKSLFSSWREALPDFVSLCLVQLPGREERMREPMILTHEQILSALVNHMQPYLGLPYVMVGHSFGSLLAYDVMAELERLSLPLPSKAFLSSFNPDEVKETKDLKAIIQLPQEEFLKKIQDRFEGIPEFVWNDKNLQKIIFPALNSDVTYVANHHPISGKISTPIITLCGDNEAIKPEVMANWKKYTRGNYEHHTVAGGHFMISENKKEYLEFLISRL